MIEANYRFESLRRFYDAVSGVYMSLLEPFERAGNARGVRWLDVQPRDRILEVGPGAGGALLAIRARVEPSIPVWSVDTSRGMLETAARRVAASDAGCVLFSEADTRALPFGAGSFDAVISSYVLELLPLGDLPIAIGELLRVLRPGGRLVLVSLSKRTPDSVSAIEQVYRLIPRSIAPYLTGGCRPVLLADMVREAGAIDVRREFHAGLVPTEWVTAIKPNAGPPH